MISVQIVSIPPGFAPIEIREQWVGLILNALSEDEIDLSTRYGVDSANVGGFIVSRLSAVVSLKIMGRTEAAGFWLGFPFGHFIQFRKDVCQIIKQKRK